MPQLLKLGFFEHWTGGVQGLVVTKPDAPFGLPMSQDMWLYYFTLAITRRDLCRLASTCCRSRSGRAFMAIRDNQIAASSMGVNVALYKTLAFGVSAGITGVAGALGAIAVQFVAPDSYTITLAISLFLGMVVGGVGWLPGSLRRLGVHHLRARTSPRASRRASPARCSACCCSSSSSWCRTARGRSPSLASNWSAGSGDSSGRTKSNKPEE